MKKGLLFVVATPIGNLDDLSPRARRVLADADLIAAEDTRHSKRLLSHFGIKTPLTSLHEHNERDAMAGLVDRLEEGASIALVSDAGTPLISDPGFHFVREAHRRGVTVSPIPGPSAAIAALSASGLPTDRYCFEGFLPAKRAARRARLAELQSETRTLIFFAAVHRITAILEDLAAVLGDGREAFVARELSKLHEQCVAATLGNLLEQIRCGQIAAKGEFAIAVAGATRRIPAVGEPPVDRLLDALLPALPGSQVAAIVADLCGLRRNDVYRRIVARTRSLPNDEA